MVNHLVVNHFSPIRHGLIFLECLQDDVNVVHGCVHGRRQLSICVQCNCSIYVVPHGCVADCTALDCVPFDKGDSKTCQEVISGLQVLVWEAGILVEFDPLYPFQEMICPGSLSILLFTAIGSTYFFCDMVSIRCEMSSALG